MIESAPASQRVAEVARQLAREEWTGAPRASAGSEPCWAELRRLGTELWLDSGDLHAISHLWTDDFTALTTNNTLVNQEVQKGIFDDAIVDAGRRLREAEPTLARRALVTEVGFVVNCRQALRLVETFGAFVSVELHPAMADDVERSVEYGRRYFSVCPERFYVKVPLTPAGYLAARRLSAEGVPVNYTLGFSARQNVLAAAFSRPKFVNVFMGRLNSFVADNGLGDGRSVGEKATMATQMQLLEGRARLGWRSLLIGASMRAASQVLDLAGLDVFTLPVHVAREYRDRCRESPPRLASQIGRRFEVAIDPPDIAACLWTVSERVYELAELLEKEDVSRWTGETLAAFAREHGLGDLFPQWTPEELAAIRADGKIPRWERWKEALLSGRIALDALMNASALQSFATDQDALDARIERLLEGILPDE